jgi:hypothetical protein
MKRRLLRSKIQVSRHFNVVVMTSHVFYYKLFSLDFFDNYQIKLRHSLKFVE